MSDQTPRTTTNEPLCRHWRHPTNCYLCEFEASEARIEAEGKPRTSFDQCWRDHVTNTAFDTLSERDKALVRIAFASGFNAKATAPRHDDATKAIIALQHENMRLRETLQRVVWLWEEDNVRYVTERGRDMAAIAKGALDAR